MTDGQRASTSTQLAWFTRGRGDGENAECVEVAWRRSSYSDGEGPDGVEVCACQAAVHVRDSKTAGEGATRLVVPPAAWAGFVALAAQASLHTM